MQTSITTLVFLPVFLVCILGMIGVFIAAYGQLNLLEDEIKFCINEIDLQRKESIRQYRLDITRAAMMKDFLNQQLIELSFIEKKQIQQKQEIQNLVSHLTERAKKLPLFDLSDDDMINTPLESIWMLKA